MSEPITHTVDVRGAVLTYDVHQPATPSEHPPLFVFGSPMAASGFLTAVVPPGRPDSDHVRPAGE